MKRRSFLKTLLGGVAATFAGVPKLKKPKFGRFKVYPADDPKKMRLGWVIYEEVGIVVINDYAISKVSVV